MRFELTTLPTSFVMEVIDKSGASCWMTTRTRPTQREIRAAIKYGKKQIDNFLNGVGGYEN